MRKRATGQFDETKHSRDDDGKFASKGGGSAAPSIRHSLQFERTPGALFEEKWGRRPGAFAAARETPVGSGHNSGRVSWQALGPKNAKLPIEYTGSTEREAPVDGYKSMSLDWQKPKGVSKKEHDAIRGALVATIKDQREAAIERAMERGLIPEDTDRRTLSRAYNLAAIRSLHEFGVASVDYRMGDELKAQMMPLTPAMRFFQRRIGDTMRSSEATKGKWQPYHEEFKVPYDDQRMDTRPGKGNQLKLKWARSLGQNTDFVKALMPGALLKAMDEAAHPRDEKGRWMRRLSAQEGDLATLWGTDRREYAKTVATQMVAGGAIGLAPVAAVVGVGAAARAGKKKARKVSEAIGQAKGAGIYARNLHEKQRRAAHYNQLLEPGESLVFRGAPTLDTDPQRRNYLAVYAANDPSTSMGYTRTGGAWGSGTKMPINHGAYALAPSTRLFNTGASGNIEAQNVAIAANMVGRRRGLSVPWKERKAKILSSVEGMSPVMRENYLYQMHAQPSRSEVLFLRGKGYTGTIGQNRNVALFNEDNIRFLAPAPNMGVYSDDVVEHRKSAASRGKLKQPRPPSEGPWELNRVHSEDELRRMRGVAAGISRWRKGNAFQRLAVRAVGIAPKVLKAHLPGEMLKADAAAVGAASTLVLADKMIAARKAKTTVPTGPKPGTAPPEVLAVLPAALRVLRRGGQVRAEMEAAPQRQRHHGNHRVIRDPGRSLAELLG